MPVTRLSLSYANVTDAMATSSLRTTTPAVALRRSALSVDADGTLRGTVVSSRLTPDQVRLRLDVQGLGELDAVAPLDRHPGPGDEVKLRVDSARLAPISADLTGQ